MNCSCYRDMMLLEYQMKTVKMVLQRFCRIVSVNEMLFGFMFEGGTINAVFILIFSKRSVILKEKVV